MGFKQEREGGGERALSPPPRLFSSNTMASRYRNVPRRVIVVTFIRIVNFVIATTNAQIRILIKHQF